MLKWLKIKNDARDFKKVIKQRHVQEFRLALMKEMQAQVPGEEFDIVMVPTTDLDGKVSAGFQLVTQSSRAMVAWSEIQYALQESLGGLSSGGVDV